jgi:hypothetical protein
VYFLNTVLNPLFSALFFPFRSAAPEWTLAWISLVTAVMALLVYRFFSAQESIRKVKEQLKANILEMRLYQDDPVLMGRAIVSVLRNNFKYLRLNLKPFLFMFIPVVLVLIQMESRFGFRPLQPGDSFLVKTIWESESSVSRTSPLSLNLSGGISLASPALRIRENQEIDWKLEVTRDGPASLDIVMNHEKVNIPVEIGERVIPVSPWNGKKGSLDMIFFPAAHPLPSSGDLLSVEIDYPRRDFRFCGYPVYWIWPYFILSLIAGYMLKGLFRVQF